MSFDQRRPSPRSNRRGDKVHSLRVSSAARGCTSGARICRALGPSPAGAGFYLSLPQKGGSSPPSPQSPVFRCRKPMGVPGQASPSKMRRVRGTRPAKHSPGGRGRCPGCAPGAAYAPDLLILSCWHPGKTGPQRAESRYQGAFWRIPGASNKYAVRPHATRPGVPRSTCDSPERRWHPRRGRTRWQCGSQLRMTGRTDGPRKERGDGLWAISQGQRQATSR